MGSTFYSQVPFPPTFFWLLILIFFGSIFGGLDVNFFPEYGLSIRVSYLNMIKDPVNSGHFVSAFLVGDFLEIDFYYKTAARMPESRGNRCGCGLAHMCSPDHCFFRAKWTSKIRPPKVSMFIVKNVCAVRKLVKFPC